jgi:RimJ/RimL family protein N-acetyltransferase
MTVRRRDALPRRAQPQHTLPGGVLLRDWRLDDAADIVLAMRDPLVRRYAGYLVDDVAAARAAAMTWAATWSSGAGAAWALAVPDGTVVGSLRFGLVDADLGTGSVGYWLAPQARGRGLAAAALRAGTTIVFAHLGWHRIELSHAVENARSCAVARRCGYRAEGVMREAMRYPDDNRRSDEHLHARLVTDPPPPGD